MKIIFMQIKLIFTRKVFSLNLFLERGNDPYCLKGLLIFWAFSDVTLLNVLPWFSPMGHLGSFSWHFPFAVSSTFWTEFLCSKVYFTILHYSFICVLVVSLVCYCVLSLSPFGPDLTHHVNDDVTHTLNPNWWRVNKPFPEATKAVTDYKAKESWLRGVLRKRKSLGKTAWKQKSSNKQSSWLKICSGTNNTSSSLPCFPVVRIIWTRFVISARLYSKHKSDCQLLTRIISHLLSCMQN